MQLRSAHGHRFFWLFKYWLQNQNAVTRTITVQELRELTTPGQNRDFSQYRSRVLQPVLTELAMLGFKVRCEEKKQAVDTLIFHLNYRKKPEPASAAEAPITSAPSNFQVFLAHRDKLQRPFERLRENGVAR